MYNDSGNTGFLLLLASYCITCIFQQTVRVKYMFSLLTYEDTCESAIQQIKISGISPLVQAISNIVTKKLKTDIVHYEMQFLSSTSNMDLHQIKHIMEKHRQKCNYDNMEPTPKKKRLQQVSSKKKSNTKLDYSMRVRQSQLLMSALKNSKRKSEKVLIMYAVYAIECCIRNQLKTS